MTSSAELVLSIPGAELRALDPPGSLFRYEDVGWSATSRALREAVWMTTQAVDRPTVFLARPEMFTEGESLDWLRRRAPNLTDHIHLSDGGGVKFVAGCRNHVFFYDLELAAAWRTLKRVDRRAPEMLSQIDMQINTALRFGPAGRSFAPRTQMLGREAPTPSRFAKRLFYLPGRMDENVARSLADDAELQGLGGGAHLFALNSRALEDATFLEAFARQIVRAAFDPSAAVLAALPSEEAETGVREVLQRIAAAPCKVPALRGRRVFVSDDGALAVHADRAVLHVHDSVRFWRYPAGAFEACARVFVYAEAERHEPAAFAALMREAWGQRVEFVWRPAAKGNDGG